MNILTIKAFIFLVVALFNLFLALMVWIRGKTKATFWFGGFAFVSGIYLFTMGGGYIFPSHVLFFTRATWIGVLMPAPFLTFLYYFGKGSKDIGARPLFLVLSYLAGIILFITAITTPYMSRGAFFRGSWATTVPGELDIVTRVYILFLAGWILYAVLKFYSTSSGFRKLQLRYFLLGIGIYAFASFVGGGLIPLIIPELTDIVVETSSLFSLVWVGLASYAILRYRLLDIKIVLGTIGIYTLTGIILINIVLGWRFLNNQLFYFSSNVVLISSALIILFIFLPIFRFFEKIAGRYFYYTFYSLQQAAQKLTKELNQIIELDKLTEFVNQSLLDALKLEKIGVVLKHPKTEAKKEILKLQGVIGYEESDILPLFSRQDDFLIKYFLRRKQLLVKQEIPYVVGEKDAENQRVNLELLKQDMKEKEIEIFLPLLVGEKLIGVVVLGKKVSGDAYTAQELDLFPFISSQAAIAFNNALSYKEIQKRKEELEHFYKLTVGRELKMIELKKRIRKLEKE